MTDDERKEKAEELRDLFVEVTDESTVTEEQREKRGTLKDDEEIDEEVREIVEEMTDEYGIRTKLDTDQLVDLVRLYYEDLSDTEIARELGDEDLNKTVSRARIKLHLLRESDFDAPFDVDELRDLLDEERSTSEMADELGVSESTVRSYANVVEAERESERVDHEYVERFEAVVEDREISEQMTSAAKDDGLTDATEDMEVDVDM
ncbi:MAG: conditioned medium-induced protein 4 [Halobacteria archaeon]|nr:conditioned medium-induced protein 4 [Halobacteria archaeon]